MIYIAYKTKSLLTELKKQSLNIDLVQKKITNWNSNYLFFDNLLLVDKDMKFSNMIYIIDERLSKEDDNNVLILVSDEFETLGRWQGIELLVGLKNKADIFVCTNRVFVKQIKLAIENEKSFEKCVDFKNFKMIKIS